MAQTKLSKARVEAICESISLGAPYDTAAKANGIHPATLYRWKEHGEAALEALAKGEKASDLTEQDRLAASLCEGIAKAEAEAETRMLSVVRNAALGAPAERDENGHEVKAEKLPQWQAAMTFLERKYPARYARRVHVRDDTPRVPADADRTAIAKFDEAFARAYGAELPDIDPANLMPSIGFEGGSEDARRNGGSG